MPLDDFDDLIDHTLDDYLLALAQGIQQAQRQLDQLTVPGLHGQPTIAYHLPRVEFELKMTFAMHGQRSDGGGSGGGTGSGAPQSARAGGAGGPGGAGGTGARQSKMLWRPAGPSSSETYSGEATSVIRGSFVAVPVAGGRPPTLVRCALTRKSGRDFGLVVEVTDALGVPQADVEVQLNVDRERSAELGTPAGRTLSAETNVLAGVVRTDASGRAESTLHIAPAEPAGTVVVVTVDALGATETVMAQVAPAGPGAKPPNAPNPPLEEM